MELLFKKELINIEKLSPNATEEFKINDEIINASTIRYGENLVRVNIGGKNYNAYTALKDNKIFVRIGEFSFDFSIPDEEETSFTADAANADREEIFPPMPGSVVKVEVKEGDKVSEGDALIIVEAMKMESTLYASIDGVIETVNVKAGEQVDSDQVLIVVSKEEDAS